LPKGKNTVHPTRKLRANLKANLRKRGISPSFRKRQAHKSWINSRTSFMKSFTSNKARIDAIKASHPKLFRILSEANGIKVSVDKGSPAIVVSFSSKVRAEEAVSKEFRELAEREGLEHIVGSEVSGSAVKTVVDFGGKKQPVVLMLIDEERTEANMVARTTQIEKMRGLIDSWASKELTAKEIARGVTRSRPKYKMSQYSVTAAEQIASEVRSIVKDLKKGEITGAHIDHLRSQLETYVNEWVETEQFRMKDPKKFGKNLSAEINKAIDTVRDGLVELHPKQVVRAVESAKNLKELRRNIIERRRFIRQINRTELSEKEIETLFKRRKKGKR